MPIALLGVVGFGLYQTIWATALRTIPAGDSALLIAATPILTALIAVVAGSDILTRRKLAGAVVSFGGVGIVVIVGQGIRLGEALGGDLLTLAAAACWALYASFGAPILRRQSALRTTTWAIIAGAIFLAPLGLLEARGNDWSLVPGAAWLGLGFSAIFPAGVANVVVFHGMGLLGPTRITAYQFLVPFFAVIMGAIFLGDPILAGQLVGGAVIVAGVVLARSEARRPRPTGPMPATPAPRTAE